MQKNVPKLYSSELQGINAHLVEVEADINIGLHSFSIVGLGDKAVSEAKERINSALKHCGIKPPTRENRKVTINLAPANIKKTGSHFDLPIALAYLLSSGQIKSFETNKRLFLGELALDGTLRAVPGVLNHAILAKEMGFTEIFVPEENAAEASFISRLSVYGVPNLSSLINHLEGHVLLSQKPFEEPAFGTEISKTSIFDIKGLEDAKRAMLIAASGGHNVLLKGSPGSGKSMLAEALLSLLPPLTLNEALEVSRIYSSVGLMPKQPLITTRPFRSPHHSVSLPSLIGGGNIARPGEISLAHRGVLFLDEVPEFKRDALESLRQPLENGEITVGRARAVHVYPARFSLILAMNPCPCGFYGDPKISCKCSAAEVSAYSKKLSGPLLDRIDLHVPVARTSISELTSHPKKELDKNIKNPKALVVAAKNRQLNRFRSVGLSLFSNAEIPANKINELIPLSKEVSDYSVSLSSSKHLSPRAYHRLLKVSRTIADLEGSDNVEKKHIAEAFRYREKEDSV